MNIPKELGMVMSKLIIQYTYHFIIFLKHLIKLIHLYYIIEPYFIMIAKYCSSLIKIP